MCHTPLATMEEARELIQFVVICSRAAVVIAFHFRLCLIEPVTLQLVCCSLISGQNFTFLTGLSSISGEYSTFSHFSPGCRQSPESSPLFHISHRAVVNLRRVVHFFTFLTGLSSISGEYSTFLNRYSS